MPVYDARNMYSIVDVYITIGGIFAVRDSESGLIKLINNKQSVLSNFANVLTV